MSHSAHALVRPFLERAGIAGEPPAIPDAVDLTADSRRSSIKAS
jgi:hypothetical protein